MAEELADYVKKSLEAGHSKARIKDGLKRGGWPDSKIEAALGATGAGSIPAPKYTPSPPEPKITGTQGSGYHSRFFKLQEKENIVFETRPMKGLLWYMFITSIIGVLFFLFILSAWLIIPAMVFSAIGWLIPLTLIVIVLVIDIIVIKRRYDMRYYWITDQRVIIKAGFIGYSVNSIPLERISDALISRSFMERIFGFGSLHIQTLAGQYTAAGRRGAEANLKAIPNPEENQALISKLIKQRRKEAHLTI